MKNTNKIVKYFVSYICYPYEKKGYSMFKGLIFNRIISTHPITWIRNMEKRKEGNLSWSLINYWKIK